MAIEHRRKITGISLFGFVLPVLLAALTPAGQALGQGVENPVQSERGEPGKALMFRHPKQGYMVAIPPGAIVEHRDQVSGIAMKSRKGYLITVQTSETRTGTPLPELMAGLERRYLGKGRPWSFKLGGQPVRIAGLDAFEAMYEGAGSRVRVVVTRDGKYDYAFIFIAPPQEFDKLVADFNWVLQSFRPARGGGGEQANTADGDGLVEMMAGKVRRLTEGGLGFSVEYPYSWVAEKEAGRFVVISGQPGTPAYYATVHIQNVSPPPPAAGDSARATQIVAAGMKGQFLEAGPGARFLGQGEYLYARQGLTLKGVQFTVEYDRRGRVFRQWNIIIARPDNGVVHVWSYAAPQESYDRYGAIAGKILESWRIIAAN